MAQPQISSSRWRRFFGWFGRHEITAVFCVLVLVLGGYIAGLIVVNRYQIQAERERFEAASQEMDQLAGELRARLGIAIYRFDSCSRTTPTSLFTQGVLSCDVQIKTGYKDISRTGAQIATDSLIKMLSKRVTHFHKNTLSYEDNDLAVYGFTYGQLSCFYVSTYYEPETLPSSKETWALSNDLQAFMEIDCSSGARAEYFPSSK